MCILRWAAKGRPAALQDPETKKVETEHSRLEEIIHNFYRDSLKAVRPPKDGKILAGASSTLLSLGCMQQRHTRSIHPTC